MEDKELTYKESLRQRVDRAHARRNKPGKKDRVLAFIETMKDGPISGAESDRIWLDQIAVGEGLDICCGDFIIGEAKGVDGDETKLGADYQVRGDDLAFQEDGTLDFIVTNYPEAMPTPLRALFEWYRCLKPGGVLGIVCMDADTYTNKKGALRNHNRLNTYTKTTIAHYLYRAGFIGVEVEVTDHKTLRVKAAKGGKK
jgi:SAM-dependent methyltransferase